MTANGRSEFKAQTPADFDAEWYLSAYPDVALSGLAPAEHFLKFGRLMGRAPNARTHASQARAAKPAGPAPGLPETLAAGFGRGAGTDGTAPVAEPGDDPLIRAPDDLRFDPRPDTRGLDRPVAAGALCLMAGQTEIARFASRAGLDAALAPLAAYARLTGTGSEIFGLARTSGAESAGRQLPGALADARPGCGGARLRAGPGRIENAWFADDGRIRVHVAGGAGGTADPPGVLRAYQADPAEPAALRLLGGIALAAEGPGFFDIAVLNPLMPVLVEFSDRAGLTIDLGLLPFPSLLRGGAHAAERAALQLGYDPMDEAWRLSGALLNELLPVGNGAAAPLAVARIAVDLAGATGAERIFAPALLDWLATVFGLAVGPAAAPDRDTDPGRRHLAGVLEGRAGTAGDPRRDGAELTLTLPARALPALGALVSRRLALPDGRDAAAGPYLVADAANGQPLWSVALPMAAPAAGADLPVLSRDARPARSGSSAPAHWLAPLHLAVVHAAPRPMQEVLKLMPVAPDAPEPDAGGAADAAARPGPALVLTATEPALTARFLAAFARQRGNRSEDLVLRIAAAPDKAAEIETVARSLFTGRCRVLDGDPETSDLDRIAAATRAERLLLAEDSVILYDPRALPRLQDMLDADDRAATASCALLHEALFKNTTRIQVAAAGLFPSQISLLAAPRLGLCEPDCLEALPETTYPVIANGFALCLMRRDAIRATAAARAGLPAGPSADLKFGLDAFAAGWRSLCTTRVRAGTTRPPGRRDEIDPLGLACLLPARWDDLLAQVTVLRQLRG